MRSGDSFPRERVQKQPRAEEFAPVKNPADVFVDA